MATNTEYVIPVVDAKTNIKYGQRGDQVKSLQTLLNTQGYNLAVDGDFRNKTLSALKQAQTKFGITSDGIYGTQTMGAFNGLNNTPATPIVPPQQAVVQPPENQVPVADNQSVPPQDQSFNYKPENDPLFTNALNLEKSAIDEEMAARGMLGSTITGERYAQATAGLGLQYRDQAYNIYKADRDYKMQQQETEYNKIRQQKQDLLQSAEVRGYFNNEEARAWGLPAGTKTQSTLSREAQAQEKKDAENTENNIVLTKKEQSLADSRFKTVNNAFATAWMEEDPIKTMNSLLYDSGLSIEDIAVIVDYAPKNPDNKYTARQYLELLLLGTVDGALAPNTNSTQSQSEINAKHRTSR